MPFVSEKFMREYEDLVRTVKNINGPGVRVVFGQGVSIAPQKLRWTPPAPPSKPTIIVVDLTQTGGDANPVSFTYTAKAEGAGQDAEPLGEDLSPVYRPFSGNASAASKGLADYGGSDGELRLLVAFESYGKKECTPPEE